MQIDVPSDLLVRCGTRGSIFFYLISPTFFIDPFPIVNKALELTTTLSSMTRFYEPECSRPLTT